MAKSVMNSRKGFCYLCGREGATEEHHIFGGPNRKLSEKYGLKVYLCHACHRTGQDAVHVSAETMARLRKAGQAAFERSHDRESFMRIFGKNYMESNDV